MTGLQMSCAMKGVLEVVGPGPYSQGLLKALLCRAWHMGSRVILQPLLRLLGTSQGAGTVSFLYSSLLFSLAMGETKAPRHRTMCPGLNGENRGAALWEWHGHSSAETKVWAE